MKYVKVVNELSRRRVGKHVRARLHLSCNHIVERRIAVKAEPKKRAICTTCA